MRTVLTILCFCLLTGFASMALAQTPDGETPAEETVCDGESGAAFGLCNAYCEAMDCELANDGDPNTEPNASPVACDKVGSKFTQFTGRPLPCEVTEPPIEDCPCVGFAAGWNDPSFVSGNWDVFVAGLFSAGTTCTDTGTRIELNDPSGDAGIGSAIAAVEYSNPLQCELSLQFSGSATFPGLTAGQALGCRQDLLDGWELNMGVGTPCP